MAHWRLWWFCATTGGVPRRAFGVTVVVGTLLNAINQGGALLGDGKIHWIKLSLTYCIPYCVATYGAVTARMAALRAAAGEDLPAGQRAGHVDHSGRTVITSTPSD